MEGAARASAKFARKSASDRGAALLIVLAILAVLSILVLGFVASMTTEVSSSRAVQMSYHTKMVAHGALSHAIETLRSNIPDPTPITSAPGSAPGRNWATNPGRITIIAPNGELEAIPLHSGEAPNPEGDVVFDARSTDLNRPLPGSPFPPIAAGQDDEERPEMRVAWIPVLKDPTEPASPDNRMTGRYAFWIDDETSRLNVSVALGKPEPTALAVEKTWQTELEEGMVTPHFKIQGNSEDSIGDGPTVSLGHPWSNNLNVLFDDEENFPVDLTRLYHESRMHGFQRFPDAILRFVQLDPAEKRIWYAKNRWNMTFYNRSPEFNAFGLSRLFVLHSPSPLYAGPAYQMPFTRGEEDFLNGLYSFQSGYGTHSWESEKRQQASSLNLAAGRHLMQYFHRKWPGQSASFVSKYGPEECRQMILNLLLFSQFATARSSFLKLKLYGNSDTVSVPIVSPKLTGSMNYCGEDIRPEATNPDRFYWYLNDEFEVDFTEPPMLPQTPGLHMNEIKFVVEPVEHFDEEGRRFFFLRYYYEIEYFLHPEHPRGNYVRSYGGSFLPVKVDYLKLEAGDHTQEFNQPDWDDPNLRKLSPGQGAYPPLIGAKELNHRVVRSPRFFLTEDSNGVGKGKRVRFDPFSDGEIDFAVNLRIGLGLGSAKKTHGVKQMVPLGTEPEDTLEAEISIDLSFPDPEYSVSWEVEDPRVSWHKDDWKLREGEDSMGAPNSSQPPEIEADEYSCFKYVSLPRFLREEGVNAGSEEDEEGTELYAETEYDPTTRFPSAGYISMIHSGIQNRTPWQTLKLHHDPGANPQDWILLDLIGSTFPAMDGQGVPSRSLPDHWTAITYMNSTAGKVNLNNKVYPESRWFNPPARTAPLRAVFRHMRSELEIDSLLGAIQHHQSSSRVFEYVGDLALIKGYEEGNTKWERESLLRNLASCLTTRSNTFGVWGVAQSVAKSRRSKKPDEFEIGDSVLGEKRFFALVERYVWPGRDGIPGNGHIDDDGIWDRLAEPPAPWYTVGGLVTFPGAPPQMRAEGKFGSFDGPEPVGMAHEKLFAELPFQKSSLGSADNPPHALVKYRVLYFKYLDH